MKKIIVVCAVLLAAAALLLVLLFSCDSLNQKAAAYITSTQVHQWSEIVEPLDYFADKNGLTTFHGWTFFAQRGRAYKGWRVIDNHWYYFSETIKPLGHMQTQTLLFDGRNYSFDEKGRLLASFNIRYEGIIATQLQSSTLFMDCFESLPLWLKGSVDKVTFLPRAEFDKLYDYHMAVTEYSHGLRPKYSIFINYGKLPSSAEGQFGYLSIAAHESAHALDTSSRFFSWTSKWRAITKEYGKKIYSIKPDDPCEVFAGAVAWYITDPDYLMSISTEAYEYIDGIAS